MRRRGVTRIAHLSGAPRVEAALGFCVECGDSSPLWDFFGFWGALSDLAHDSEEKTHRESQSGEESPHSTQNPKAVTVR
jgi:hypothetical protein